MAVSCLLNPFHSPLKSISMADKNFNQGQQSQQSNQDWESDRNRYNQDNEWSLQQQRSNYRNPERDRNQNYGDVGYSGDSVRGMGWNDEGTYNRVNYLPDNDDNRYEDDYRYGNSGYGSSGRQGRGNNYNSGGYRREDQNRYGNANYGNQQHQWNQRGRGNYGNQYGNESDWSRRHSQQSGAGNWGSDYGRQDWGRASVNTGNEGNQQDYDSRNFGGNYGNTGYYDSNRDWNRGQNRNRGNAGNYGNSNRGSDNDWWERTKDKVSGWFGSDDDNSRNRDYSGGHRGKGPSDYRRSQDRIREDICDRLTDDDRIDASHVRVQIEDDAVILSGTVNSREEKRRAEDLVESISGVRNVENRLRVGRGDDYSARDYTGTTDQVGGIGSASGTTNEIIRDNAQNRTEGTDKNRNKNS